MGIALSIPLDKNSFVTFTCLFSVRIYPVTIGIITCSQLVAGSDFTSEEDRRSDNFRSTSRVSLLREPKANPVRTDLINPKDFGLI